MASIKLGQLLGQAQSFLGFGGSTLQNPKAMASDLLNSNPLEVPANKEPISHMRKDPLGFANLYYPKDLGEQSGQGHYMIFYSISTDHSKIGDQAFNNSLGAKVTGGQDLDTGEFSYNVKTLKSKSEKGNTQLAKPLRNTVGTGSMATHNSVTGAVALYMPPGIKVEYSVENGATDLGISGMGVNAIKKVVDAQGTEAAIEAFLEGTGSFSVEGAKRAGIAFGEAVGLGDISGAFSKVTGTAMNPFSEVVFERVNHRSFNYTFSLIARNKQEVMDIDKIIKFFKYHMHPELEMSGITAGRYFRVPSEFEIFYAYNDIVNEYMNKISRCVLTNVSVDYGGDQFSTFRRFDSTGAAPVNITMSLSFGETEIMTKERILQGY